jgi:uncharacterized pyridoxamine 5'-phosphate oxidase family protein
MTTMPPETQLHPGFSDVSAHAVPWTDARETIEKAEIFWLSTVRPDGRPHVTPLIAVWVDDDLYFCTGEDERKRRNLAQNPNCVLTTGCNSISAGLDIVVEGKAVRVISEAQLQTIATAFEAKYGPAWHFDVHADAFSGGEGNVAWVYRVVPVTAFGFAKGQPFSQTRWRF